jgi:hypothetical protein
MDGRSMEVRCPWDCGAALNVTEPRVGVHIYLCGTCRNYVAVFADGRVLRHGVHGLSKVAREGGEWDALER